MNPDDFDFSSNIEQGIEEVMSATLAATALIRPDLPEYLLRAKICAVNLRSLVNVILMADDPESATSLDLKQTALGLLATADWLEPSDEFINTYRKG